MNWNQPSGSGCSGLACSHAQKQSPFGTKRDRQLRLNFFRLRPHEYQVPVRPSRLAGPYGAALAILRGQAKYPALVALGNQVAGPAAASPHAGLHARQRTFDRIVRGLAHCP